MVSVLLASRPLGLGAGLFTLLVFVLLSILGCLYGANTRRPWCAIPCLHVGPLNPPVAGLPRPVAAPLHLNGRCPAQALLPRLHRRHDDRFPDSHPVAPGGRVLRLGDGRTLRFPPQLAALPRAPHSGAFDRFSTNPCPPPSVSSLPPRPRRSRGASSTSSTTSSANAWRSGDEPPGRPTPPAATAPSASPEHGTTRVGRAHGC